MKQVRTVVLVGAPNVGKSSVFNILTGQYVTVSNYPGTTVDIAKGYMQFEGKQYLIIDTPGAYSLSPLTEEERVTRDVLLYSKPDAVINIVDAKNITRMLPLTIELLEAGLPVILQLNMIDEAQTCGIFINITDLSARLGIPIVATSVKELFGFKRLCQILSNYQYVSPMLIKYDEATENLINSFTKFIAEKYMFNERFSAMLLMKRDSEAMKLLLEAGQDVHVLAAIQENELITAKTLLYTLSLGVHDWCLQVLAPTMTVKRGCANTFAEKLGRWLRQPLTGIPILGIVLYFGLYLFVGRFSAGYLVDYLDHSVFSRYITPFVMEKIQLIIPAKWLQNLIIGNYGIVSMGFRYAAVVILPIVSAFFLVFSLLEDSGYLPRLAMLSNNLFKPFGLNGRFMIPLSLGFGCGTMAIMVTRTLEGRRERILASFLLALCIPCSAQLGLVMSLLSFSLKGFMLWLTVVFFVFIIAGTIADKIIPGEKSCFYMEIPPMRMPQINNVVKKTYARTAWYFMEIVPIFIFVSACLWFLDESGTLPYVIKLLQPFILALGLPEGSATTFLLGFFRRDYGAAGLYDMYINNELTHHQLLVAAVTLTLFVPCIAQMAVMVKERGILCASTIFLTVMLAAFVVGVVLHKFLCFFPILI